MLLVVMGVCGCGKTSVGKALQEKTDCSFADADDFHSKENKMKMSNGQPLTDEDRYPWLCSIHRHLCRQAESKRGGIITCSALKRSYRDILKFGSTPSECTQAPSSSSSTSCDPRSGLDLVFVHLTGSEEVLQKRLNERKGHFMQARMLQSQVATLEPLNEDEQGLDVDIAGSLDDVVNQVLDYCASHGWINGR